MTFDSDLNFALKEAEREFGTAAVWYRHPQALGEPITLTGVFSAEEHTQIIQDAGWEPGIDATYLCDLEQFDITGGLPVTPEVGHTIVINSLTYRVSLFSKDETSISLGLRKAP